MIQDINSMYNWDSGDLYAEGRIYSEYFPTIYRFGTKFNYKNIRIVADGGFITNYRIGKKESDDIFVNLLPRLGVEYTYQDLYYFRGGLGNGRIAFGWGLEYDLIKDHDSRIDYTFSMDWASQLAHTFSYAFNF